MTENQKGLKPPTCLRHAARTVVGTIQNPKSKIQNRMTPNYHSIDWLPGLTKREQSQLKDCGIITTEQLLQQTKTDRAKQSLAKQLQVNLRTINKWVALADLGRIPSVGYQYSGVLLHSGVASVSQLIEIPIFRLHRQILRLHVATLQKQTLCPPVNIIQQWIIEGRILTLPPLNGRPF